MTGSRILVVLTLGALCAAFALLAAYLRVPVAPHVLAIAAALCGFGAFLSVAASTIRDARRLPASGGRP